MLSSSLCTSDNGNYVCRKGSGVALLGLRWAPLSGLPGAFPSKSGGAGEEAPASHQPAAAHLSDAVGEEDPTWRGGYAARASWSGDTGPEQESYWEKCTRNQLITSK